MMALSERRQVGMILHAVWLIHYDCISAYKMHELKALSSWMG